MSINWPELTLPPINLWTAPVLAPWRDDMSKRYRRPKTKEGQIISQRGKVDGEVDMCLFYGDNVPRCDRALVMNVLYSERQYTDIATRQPKYLPSFADELEARGYDLDTLRFSIERKAQPEDGDS